MGHTSAFISILTRESASLMREWGRSSAEPALFVESLLGKSTIAVVSPSPSHSVVWLGLLRLRSCSTNSKVFPVRSDADALVVYERPWPTRTTIRSVAIPCQES